MRIVEGRLPSVDATMRFRVHDGADLHVSASIEHHGVWEPFESDFVRVLINALANETRPTLVDCGANVGWYSVLGAVLGARVLAFEPMPSNASLLRFNVEANHLADHVTVFEMALGAVSGTADLHLSETNQGDHRLHCGASMNPAKERRTVRVIVEPLDELLNGDPPGRPHLIKIDTQGSEVAILRGAARSWQPTPGLPDVSIVTEFWPYGLTRCGSSAEEFVSTLGPLVDRTHVCIEIQEWSSSLIRRSASELAEMAASPGLSLDVRGFTNLAFVPNDLYDRCESKFATGVSSQ